MSTTELRIELLIIGFQATIWIIILFGVDNSIALYTENAKIIEDTSAIIILAMLAWCYSLGAVVDGVTAVAEDPMSVFKKSPTTPHDSSIMRLKFHEAYKELIASDFELRLLRSTSINMLVIGLSIWFSFSFSVLVLAILTSSFLAGIAWFRRKQKTEKRRDALYEAANKLESAA